jgi:uncharacterized membrane protein
MREWLIAATENAITIIDGLALVVIVFGTIQAFLGASWLAIAPAKGPQRRDVWLRYARWLVAGLTFQLASDIIETSITTSWEAVGRIAAVAVIRTFLDYFLERDVTDVRERQHTATAKPT